MAFGSDRGDTFESALNRLQGSVRELKKTLSSRTLPQGWYFRDNAGTLEVVNIDTGVSTPLT